ncbi:MAG: endonuclease/exonuclease/phosphatase family protein [Oligoflexales bacterium]|nr:endonuclease/exonuclease/phosphatase family protein [Oligoflexales bacterium]
MELPYSRQGQNLASFLSQTWPNIASELQRSSLFVQANTGKNAKKDESGNYCLSKEPSQYEVLNFADQQNFGLFPGQYSSFLASRFIPALAKPVVIKDLKWNEFNPGVDLDAFAAGNGEPIDPDIQLFDKVFYSLPVLMDGHLVHIVSLHTVPYFHFGNSQSPNYARNFDQLRFLSWYLHGDAQGLQVNAQKLWLQAGLKPLPAGSKYIVLGDLNVDTRDKPNSEDTKAFDSAKVLSEIITNGQIPFDLSQFTFDSGWLKKFFDYVIFSKHFQLSNPRIWNHKYFPEAEDLSDHFALTVDFFIP